MCLASEWYFKKLFTHEGGCRYCVFFRIVFLRFLGFLSSTSLSSILASLMGSLIKTHRGSLTPTRTFQPHCQTLAAAAKTCFPVCLCQKKKKKKTQHGRREEGAGTPNHIYLISAFQNMASIFSARAAEVQTELRKESSAVECLFKWGRVTGFRKLGEWQRMLTKSN